MGAIELFQVRGLRRSYLYVKKIILAAARSVSWETSREVSGA